YCSELYGRNVTPSQASPVFLISPCHAQNPVGTSRKGNLAARLRRTPKWQVSRTTGVGFLSSASTEVSRSLFCSFPTVRYS
ncbi:hypothetical protein FA13DRAFT_1727093, partial [Coprinellus micaceus]